MKEEINVIEKNKTWRLVDKLQNKDVSGVKWIYKVKYHIIYGSMQRNKTRFVAKDYSWQYGIDYDETYALVARVDTSKILFALACHKGCYCINLMWNQYF